MNLIYNIFYFWKSVKEAYYDVKFSMEYARKFSPYIGGVIVADEFKDRILETRIVNGISYPVVHIKDLQQMRLEGFENQCFVKMSSGEIKAEKSLRKKQMEIFKELGT